MGREIRRVPANWQHPKYIKTHYYRGEGYVAKEIYKPMYDDDYDESVKEYEHELKEWFEGHKLWSEGYYIDYSGNKKTKKECFDEWLESIENDRKKNGFREDYRLEEKMKYETGHCLYSDVVGEVPTYPDPDDYMPIGNWYQLFETVSEGTPLSPAFETKQELVDWLTNNEDYWGDKWTREQAEGMVKHEYSPSFVIENGVLKNPQKIMEETTNATAR